MESRTRLRILYIGTMSWLLILFKGLRLRGMLSLVEGVPMKHVRHFNLCPTVGSDPESLGVGIGATVEIMDSRTI